MANEIYTVPVEKLHNIFSYNSNQEQLAHELTCFFYENLEDEITYIEDHSTIIGIVTIGDLFRYYRSEVTNFINSHFTYLDEYSESKTMEIFHSFPSIHEIPIINENHILKMVIKKLFKRNTNVNTSRKNSLYTLKHIRLRHQFYSNNLKHILKEFPNINILIYICGDIRPYLNKSEYETFQNKIEYPNYSTTDEAKRRGWSIPNTSVQYNHYKGFYIPENIHSDFLTIADHHRIVPNASKSKNKIFLVGPCMFFGAYVKDTETIEYYLQNFVNNNHLPYEVVNASMSGPENEFNCIFNENLKETDTIIFLLQDFIPNSNEKFFQFYKGNICTVYSKINNPLYHILDNALHCDGYVNQAIATKIWNDLKSSLNSNPVDSTPRRRIQNYFISLDIHLYFADYMEKYQLSFIKDKVIGSIVMNCNPFTYGHQYLIDKAVSEVDLLYVFVVEEDQSTFQFNDRLKMVKLGTKHLKNVKVLPSGKYVISKETFAQYFDKEQIKEISDMSYDLRIFAEVIAKGLNITKRFVGEEPNDLVTHEYNETMKKILPEYGIEVIEYPRLKENNTVISASTVRKHLSENITDIEKLCPPSTIEYLTKLGYFSNT